MAKGGIKKPMKFAFIIQGEGRGHQTQAISLSEMLTSNGHEVVLALVGTCNPEQMPILLKEKANFRMESFQSPSLVYDPKTKALSLTKTLKNALPNLLKYINSIRKIKKLIEEVKPDVIINFYDFLGGLYSGFCSPKAKVVCIGHQYLLLNRNFTHPRKDWLDAQIVNLNTRITALGADKLLALSFSEFPNDNGIISVPPLLRNELVYYSNQNQDFLLVYFTQSELLDEIVVFAQNNPLINFEVFVDRKIGNIPPNIRLNPISSSLFLEKMAKCKGIISTAGFESVCEAMYLGKPALMVPIKKHYEQLCNAYDAQRAGAGIYSATIDVDLFLRYLQTKPAGNHQQWINKSEEIFMYELGISRQFEESTH
ncbi:MAG TPA: glycosyltransferase family protein [Leadbetterella sp.]|nr:glycosyltransferase family protein [Leadbetterella sp.]